MDVASALDLVETARSGREFMLVGIGGLGCSGKTTLARAIPHSRRIPTDAFWDGAEFRLDRLRDQVLDPLRNGVTAKFAAWDWSAARSAGWWTVAPRGVVIIEGVCALHRSLRDAYDLRLWVDAPQDVRLARARSRDGADAIVDWIDRWIPSETEYLRDDDPVACADAIVSDEPFA